eukprot:GHRQ01011200.1.p4 GENE.GHRQ01011200.1~~GHRQ01011200.1.p4  ORF type:complete len:135 (-),score=51.58 GHRQ01011200.1:25-429(-)
MYTAAGWLPCRSLEAALSNPVQGSTRRFSRVQQLQCSAGSSSNQCSAVLLGLPAPCRHSYVRRNAVLAISALCKLPKGELLVPDADELIERFLGQEQDVSAKRNALMLLTQHSQVRPTAAASTAVALHGRRQMQ